MKKWFIILFGIILLFTSCVSNEIIIDLHNNPENSGSLLITTSGTIKSSIFKLDDSLLVDRAKVSDIELKNVPIGDHRISFTSNYWGYTDTLRQKNTVTIEKNKRSKVNVIRPHYNEMYYITTILLSTAGAAALIFIVYHSFIE